MINLLVTYYVPGTNRRKRYDILARLRLMHLRTTLPSRLEKFQWMRKLCAQQSIPMEIKWSFCRSANWFSKNTLAYGISYLAHSLERRFKKYGWSRKNVNILHCYARIMERLARTFVYSKFETRLCWYLGASKNSTVIVRSLVNHLCHLRMPFCKKGMEKDCS